MGQMISVGVFLSPCYASCFNRLIVRPGLFDIGEKSQEANYVYFKKIYIFKSTMRESEIDQKVIEKKF